jgi:hypothetical protein
LEATGCIAQINLADGAAKLQMKHQEALSRRRHTWSAHPLDRVVETSALVPPSVHLQTHTGRTTHQWPNGVVLCPTRFPTVWN